MSLELASESTVLSNIGLYSYGTASLAYSMLVLLVFIARRNNPLGNALLAASSLTAVWAAVVMASTILSQPQVLLIQVSEIARNAAWIFVLLKLIGTRVQGTTHVLASNRWIPWFTLLFSVILIAIPGIALLAEKIPSLFYLSLNLSFFTWIAMSVLGLLLLEQFFRNSSEAELWATKHLCLGLGILFVYDFFMYAEALLFRQMDPTSWQARGIVSAMAAILMAISISRTDQGKPPEKAEGIHLSRHVAFHSLTLMASGIYLITMALAAYFIRYLGGSWGGVLQITFLCAAGLTLVVLLFSGRIRASARVWLSKNFFSYKYDYRLEWLQFTHTLASGQNDIPENITRAVAHLVKSPAGLLWSRTEDGRFNIVANWEMPAPSVDIDLGSLAQWLQKEGWIIDLREWRRSPDLYRDLKLPIEFSEISRAWLIIPLLFGERLQGILLLRESDLLRELNWEDRDLLKVAGKQAGSLLAQFQADKALMESRQFEAFNRLSAYVIHDLKNILAQLSLMVSNAQKHKHNPEFIDDMVGTVSNTVTRMSKLMVQLRSGTEQTEQQEFDLADLLETVVAEGRHRTPAPTLILDDKNFTLTCDRDRLQTVFSHLVQNAQEATNKDGVVTVRMMREHNGVAVEVEDNGAGMDADFVRHRLFKPFDSTKGLTGMGIGAFESRDFINSLGGNIQVRSHPGTGSLFRVHIPCTVSDSEDDKKTTDKVNNS